MKRIIRNIVFCLLMLSLALIFAGLAILGENLESWHILVMCVEPVILITILSLTLIEN